MAAQRRPVLFAVLAVALLGVVVLAMRMVLQTTEPSTQPVTMAPSPGGTGQPATPTKPAAPGSQDAATDDAAPLPEEQADTTPLPALEHSDPEVRATLADIVPSIAQPALGPDDLLRRSAVLAGNFARGKLLRDKLPFPAAAGKPAIVTRGDRIYLAAENYARYNTLVDACAELDVDAFARWFNRYEPLLQQAWGELGDGKGEVRGALIAGLDLMLAAPEVQGEIELVQPAVFYKYADPALESLPDTQKLLIRIGPGNRAVVKEKARRLRDALATM